MQVGDLVKLYGSPWLGLGIITAFQTRGRVMVYFPNAGYHTSFANGMPLHRDRLELIEKK